MTNLPTRNDDDGYIESMIKAARDDIGYGKILTFNKGEYLIDKKTVPLGTQYRVFCRAWIKEWIRFNPKPIDRRTFRVEFGEVPPKRETLGDMDRDKWELYNREPSDPWVFQYLVPFVDIQTNDMFTFRTASRSGHRTVSELCNTAAYRARMREPQIPIIKIGATTVHGGFGKFQKPEFTLVRWEEDQGVRYQIDVNKLDDGEGDGDDGEGSIPASKRDNDFDDSIPY